jgi:hypothetical protein
MAGSRQPGYALRASFWGEVPVMAGPGDEMAAGQVGRGHLRASHADREQVIDTVKAAFVQGMLTKAELDVRLGQTFAARTCGELAALTADLPPGPAAAKPVRAPARGRRRPLARAAAWSGGCLTIAVPAFWVAGYTDPFGPWRGVMVALFVCALWTAVGIMGYALFTAWDQKSPRRQLPPRPEGHALDAGQRGGTGHGPVSPGPGAGRARADLQAHKPRQHRQRLPARAGRAPRGTRPAPGTA